MFVGFWPMSSCNPSKNAKPKKHICFSKVLNHNPLTLPKPSKYIYNHIYIYTQCGEPNDKPSVLEGLYQPFRLNFGVVYYLVYHMILLSVKIIWVNDHISLT